ncbi:MAG: hypothetical protein DHS80DRAFT_25933 [Piptocephalis tieghemiana]|nr:MAG: hypothetical protein DHS80DRAFT_25933 [Piptocephalis tieghemiana]
MKLMTSPLLIFPLFFSMLLMLPENATCSSKPLIRSSLQSTTVSAITLRSKVDRVASLSGGQSSRSTSKKTVTSSGKSSSGGEKGFNPVILGTVDECPKEDGCFKGHTFYKGVEYTTCYNSVDSGECRIRLDQKRWRFYFMSMEMVPPLLDDYYKRWNAGEDPLPPFYEEGKEVYLTLDEYRAFLKKYGNPSPKSIVTQAGGTKSVLNPPSRSKKPVSSSASGSNKNSKKPSYGLFSMSGPSKKTGRS